MRSIVAILVSIAVVACNPTAKWQTTTTTDSVENPNLTPYHEKVQQHRDSMSAVFFSGSNGVLEKKDISPLGKLQYFDVSEQYRVGARFEPIENGEVFEMKTSTDRLPEYRKFGNLHFELLGDSLSLTLYQNVEQPEHLFCPFKDLTNGKKSYGAGRYLDFALDDLEVPTIDFNYCYNPYCAYNHKYSCPIPPYENHLDVEIKAGEKKWH